MNDRRMGEVIQHLRQMVRPEQSNGLPDSELLRRWAADRDEAAFELLLWRYGPMVFGVCRRVLHDGHAAEDAFQATFLALARKGGSIGKREAVAAWLYRVAQRASLRAKTNAAKQPKPSATGLDALPARANQDIVLRDLRPVLDEEVNRLSPKNREVFILHYLQGRTNEEVARELRCPVGTVDSRLGRAREQLRARLTKRGLALSAALALGLTADALSAAVPVGVVGPLVKAAALVAAGQPPAAGLVSANAVALAATVVRGMAIAKVKVVGILVLVFVLAAAGTEALVHRVFAGPDVVEPSPADNEIRAPAKAARTAWHRPGIPLAAPGLDAKRDNVPRGQVAAVEYDVKDARGIHVKRKMLVYTPPGYTKDVHYPVLYLLHGLGDDETGWQKKGAADVILDNLYAENKIVPMIVVMPNCKQCADKFSGTPGFPFKPFDCFETDLLHEIIPYVESHYSVQADRDHRAVAGLSTGATLALEIGLKHVNQFAWVGAFSGGNFNGPQGKLVPDPEAAKQLQLLWLSCGDRDRIAGWQVKSLHLFLDQKKVSHVYHLDAGGHEWPVWKNDLYLLSQRLFRN